MKREIYLGDEKQGIWLKFERDGVWVAGHIRGQEIPHKCVLWSKFDEVRAVAARDPDSPSLYEKYRDDRFWTSQQPDTKSFLLAINHFFSGPDFKVSGRRIKSPDYDDRDEHLVLLYKGRPIVWDFGPLNGQPASAWEASFRRFEDSIERIKAHIAKLDSQRGPIRTAWLRLTRLFKRVKRRISQGK